MSHERLNLREWQITSTWGICTHTPVAHRKLSIKKKKNTKATSSVYYINSQSALYTQTGSINQKIGQ